MAKCPFCDNNMINGECNSCGYREYTNTENEIWGEAIEKESTVINDEPHYEEKRMTYDKRLGGLWKVLFVFITILYSPVIGLIVSIVLMTRKYPSYKSFGIKLLILSILCCIFRVILVILALFFNIALFGTQQIIEGVGTIISIL